MYILNNFRYLYVWFWGRYDRVRAPGDRVGGQSRLAGMQQDPVRNVPHGMTHR